MASDCLPGCLADCLPEYRLITRPPQPSMLSYLYQPRVADARLRDVLKALNTALGAIVRSTPQPMLRERLVDAILRECCHAIEHVLLHSGPERSFDPPDVPLVHQVIAH